MPWPMYRGTERIDGKTVIITGANTGIGKETARDLAKRGGRIILACRNTTKGEEAMKEIIDETGNNNISCKKLDLSSLESVRDFCKDINGREEKIDILINNAGVMMTPNTRTKDGFEMQIGTNHMGHFVLTNLLLDKVKAAAPSRIVILSSSAHSLGKMNFDDLNSDKNYSSTGAYQQSKLANLLHVLELTKKLQGTGVTVYGVHPGVVETELLRHTFLDGFLWTLLKPVRYFFVRSAMHGAQTSIMCAVSEKLANETGKYYADCKEEAPSPRALDEKDAERLWQVSEEWTKPDRK